MWLQPAINQPASVAPHSEKKNVDLDETERGEGPQRALTNTHTQRMARTEQKPFSSVPLNPEGMDANDTTSMCTNANDT